MSIAFEGIEQKPIADFTEKAYLDYSMYVIMDRALPHLGDGLKPVQRRIIYAMNQLALNANAKYKKSARTVGDVLGKFHPHGDTACYEAMVLLAQPFSFRYPLVDGQGNWGSPDDPKSFAAMRYTEARLAKFSEVFLQELNQGTVEWTANFDGTLNEPTILPARLPALLLNGTTGIAVGMATDVPPHNLTEVANACLHLLKNPKAKPADIFKIIKGPDFPTDAEIITPKEELQQIYLKGQGTFKMRAKYLDEQGDLVITALPHQVSGAKILEQIASQMQAKKLPLVSDLRDESDHENPTRLVIVPRSNKVDKQALMSHLFASTDLERTYRVNLNMIGLDGKPQVKPLLNFLNEWLVFRKETTRKRISHRLDKVVNRLHILDGLLIAFLNIDEVIKIIRNSDNPKAKLMKKFALSDTQADAILDLKLRNLAKLEEMQIKTEQKDLAKEREKLEQLLESDRRLKTLMAKEIEECVKLFGDKRRSPIVEREKAQVISIQTQVSTDITVVLSQKGWCRAAKGHEVDGSQLNFKAMDKFFCQVRAKSTDLIYFLDSTGRSYTILASNLPSARGLGEPLSSKLNPPSGSSFVGMLVGKEADEFALVSSTGYGFVTKLGDMATKNKSGKAVLKVADSASASALCPVAIESKQARLAVLTSEARLLVIDISELPQMARGKGNKIINIPADKAKTGDEQVISAICLDHNDSLLVRSAKRKLSLTPRELDHYLGERGRRGNKLPRGHQQALTLEISED